jgi:hypothetical protein
MFAAAITGSCPAPSGAGGRILPLDTRDRAVLNGVEALDEARDDAREDGLEIPMTQQSIDLGNALRTALLLLCFVSHATLRALVAEQVLCNSPACWRHSG